MKYFLTTTLGYSLWSISALGQTNEPSFAQKLQHFFDQAQTLAQAGEHAQAVIYWDSAVMITPHFAPVRYARAQQLMLAGKAEVAMAELQLMVKRRQQQAKSALHDSIFNQSPGFAAFRKTLPQLDKAVANSTPYVRIHERDLVPEGVAYDPAEKALYISSIYKRKIVKIGADKLISDFVASGQDGLLSVIGMEVDPKRRVLWVCSSYDPSNGVIGGDSLKRNQTALHQLDLKTGKLLKRYTLPDTLPHFFNDLTILPNGDVYITDSHAGNVYELSAKEDALKPLFSTPLVFGANGITKDPKGETLYISSWLRGILRYNLKDRSWQWLETDQAEINLSGIDGLAYYEGDLIANSPLEMQGLMRLKLDKSGKRVQTMKILEYKNPLFGATTTGELAGSTFYYIANAGLEAYDRSTGALDKSALQEPVILQLKLE